MKILMIGDVVGRSGRQILSSLLPIIKREEEIDFTIVNGENSAGGKGITPKIAEEIFDLGVDVITSGNHVWRKKEVISYLDKQPRLLRPLNYPQGTPGKGIGIYDCGMYKIAVLNALGRTFMDNVDCPFTAVKREITALNSSCDVVVVDFHAEATSERIAMGRYLDGLATIVFGTHTHVQTSDERILPGGTGYLSDLGMTGAYNSVLGVEIEQALRMFLTQLPTRLTPADGEAVLEGLIAEVDTRTGSTQKLERIRKFSNLS